MPETGRAHVGKAVADFMLRSQALEKSWARGPKGDAGGSGGFAEDLLLGLLLSRVRIADQFPFAHDSEDEPASEQALQFVKSVVHAAAGETPIQSRPGLGLGLLACSRDV